MKDQLRIRGARTHNLKGIDLDVPKDKLVVFTGVSGSGKSSLVFDTIHTEAQRQLIETFGSFARRRLPKFSRPPVESIENLSTSIVIDQKRMGRNPRSTVGTATELLTYLRLLMSRCGAPNIGPSFFLSFNNPQGMCPDCRGIGMSITVDTKLLIDPTRSLMDGAVTHPDYKVGGWNWRELVGLGLFDNDKPVGEFTEAELNTLLHAEGIPVDRRHGAGTYTRNFEGIAYRLERLYHGKDEDGLPEERKGAYERYFRTGPCGSCGGTRLNDRARSVRLNGMSIDGLSELELTELDAFLAGVGDPVGAALVGKMRGILGHLISIGVGYLSLIRAVSTLSGGESQRVKMARQLDCDLTGLMYILDEPTTGLHPKDGDKLIGMLERLKEKGNSVFVVEHDPDIITAADWVVDVGPRAGANGGKLLFSGPVDELLKADTITASYLRNRGPEAYAGVRRRAPKGWLQIRNANLHNLKGVDADIPTGVLTCITGVAGSGKSSLIHGVFVPEHPEAVVIDQTAPNKSSRSNPATYIGVFDLIRTEMSAATGGDRSLFSFNSKGACPKCNGMGTVAVEMGFMDDVRMGCDECSGMRYRPEVLELRYKGRNIFDVLEMTAEEAAGFLETKEITKRLRVLVDVGLGYLKLGQSFSTLSGGESQRIKLAGELHKKGNLYVMDEPTTGLHPADIERFMGVVARLVDRGNTVVIIEHNLDVIRQADWVIDMGPEGGRFGGEILFSGTPEGLAECGASHTGKHLAPLLKGIEKVEAQGMA